MRNKEIANKEQGNNFELSSHRESLSMNDNSKPKVAVLLTGHYRKGQVVPSLHKIGDFDVFAFAWDDFGCKGHETNLCKSEPLAVESAIKSLPNIKSYKIGNNKNFIESIREETESRTYFNHSSKEVFIKSQLYSIKKTYELFDDFRKSSGVSYDVVIKLRFDCSLRSFSLDQKTMYYIAECGAIFVTNDGCHNHDHFSNGCIICNKLYDLSLHIPHIGDHPNIICDLMAYGSVEAMREYCGMYDVYDRLNGEFIAKNRKFLSERNLPFSFEGRNIAIGRMDSIFYLYCSYPERIIQHHLSDRMLVSSRSVSIDLHRR